MAQVRISDISYNLLKSLSIVEGRSMQDVIDRAIEDYRRKAFLEGLNEDYKRLRADTAHWSENLEEAAVWENVLTDGLEQDDAD